MPKFLAIFFTFLCLSFRTFFECVRFCTFGTSGFQQMQVDIQFLRDYLPCFVEDISVLEMLLEEVITSTAERCVEATPIEPSILTAIIKAKRASFTLA